MKTAWINNTEYDLPDLCCEQLEKSPDMQLQDNEWFVFGNDEKRKPDKIYYCSFCGKKLKRYKHDS